MCLNKGLLYRSSQ